MSLQPITLTHALERPCPNEGSELHRALFRWYSAQTSPCRRSQLFPDPSEVQSSLPSAGEAAPCANVKLRKPRGRRGQSPGSHRASGCRAHTRQSRHARSAEMKTCVARMTRATHAPVGRPLTVNRGRRHAMLAVGLSHLVRRGGCVSPQAATAVARHPTCRHTPRCDDCGGALLTALARGFQRVFGKHCVGSEISLGLGQADGARSANRRGPSAAGCPRLRRLPPPT